MFIYWKCLGKFLCMNLCLDFLPFDLVYFRCTLCSDAYFYLVYSCCSWAPFFCFLARFEGVDFFMLKVICSFFFFHAAVLVTIGQLVLGSYAKSW
jgi:hypothetical protein